MWKSTSLQMTLDQIQHLHSDFKSLHQTEPNSPIPIQPCILLFFIVLKWTCSSSILLNLISQLLCYNVLCVCLLPHWPEHQFSEDRNISRGSGSSRPFGMGRCQSPSCMSFNQNTAKPGNTLTTRCSPLTTPCPFLLLSLCSWTFLSWNVLRFFHHLTMFWDNS